MNRYVRMLGLASITALAMSTTVGAQELKLMTGPQGGVWVPLGGQLKDLWEKAVPGLGAVKVAALLEQTGIARQRGRVAAHVEDRRGRRSG